MGSLKKLFLAIFFGGICICAYAASEDATTDFDSGFLVVSDANRTIMDSELSLFAVNSIDEGKAGEMPVQMETKILGSGIREAGNHLRNYRAVYYGGLLWRAVSQILSTGKSPAESLAIGLPGTALLMLADYKVGKAGEQLEIISKSDPAKDLYLLSEAGRNLRKYRSITYAGHAIEYASRALVLAGMADDNDTLILSGALGSLTATVIASICVGYAGRNIQAIADDFPQYQDSLKGAGKNFVAHRDRLYSFLVCFGLATGMLATRVLVPETAIDAVTAIDVATGAALLVGIIEFLRAHWYIGVAGENLEMAR